VHEYFKDYDNIMDDLERAEEEIEATFVVDA
jgi:hypothetical protein